jgi:hypothetical protein
VESGGLGSSALDVYYSARLLQTGQAGAEVSPGVEARTLRLTLQWSRGAQIAIREHWNNKVWTVRPVTVVADTPDVIALYMMTGTIYKHPRAIDGSPVPHFLPDEWVLVDMQWFGGGALYLSPPGQWYVIMGLFGDDNQRIERW